MGTAENVARALVMADAYATDLESDDQLSRGFGIRPDEQRDGVIELFDSDGFGEPEHVITFVKRSAEAFGLSGR